MCWQPDSRGRARIWRALRHLSEKYCMLSVHKVWQNCTLIANVKKCTVIIGPIWGTGNPGPVASMIQQLFYFTTCMVWISSRSYQRITEWGIFYIISTSFEFQIVYMCLAFFHGTVIWMLMLWKYCRNISTSNENPWIYFVLNVGTACCCNLLVGNDVV